MSISQKELEGLFQRFAAPPVNGEAAKRFGKAVAKQLAQTFWHMMIQGPMPEAYLWNSFGESFTPDDVAMLRRCFEEEMKPSLSLTQQYFEYLKANLVFPFPATYSHHDGKRRILHNVSVVGMSDDFPIEDEYGLVCKVKDEKEEWEVPLMLMDVGKDDRNHQLVEEYDRWFAQWGDFVPPSYPHVGNDDSQEDEEPEPPPKKAGRNDPYPCGSGKKFEKCCLHNRGSDLFG